MLVYVLNSEGKPLMPCNAARARKLLEGGKAKVMSRSPFTIKLLFGSSGYVQKVSVGIDTGSKTIGASASLHGKVFYAGEATTRQDISSTLKQ